MVIKFLRLAGDNKLEHFGVINEPKIVPRPGEFVNILSNRFKVAQIEWFPLNQEVFVYLEDIPVVSE
jgi:hypothetical protein